jgi:UDP-glucose 4-epimerase
MNMVYSSSAAVYGAPTTVPIPEEHPKGPLSPYGRCKIVAEQLLQDADRAYGLRSVSLRYFNAAGADWEEGLGEDHHPETHLIPNIMRVVLASKAHAEGRKEAAPEPLHIYGDDYPTPDGTCIRDYIHVADLARAHLLALGWLDREGTTIAINLGSENGASVKEVIEAVEAVTGITVPTKVESRREGDPPRLVASSRKANELLGWEPINSDLHHIVDSAWRWHESHPFGFSTDSLRL